MKKLLLLFSLFFVLAASFPKARGYVTDEASVLSQNAEAIIASLAGQLESKSGAQLAVFTVKSLNSMSIEDYAWQLFERTGIGQKGKDTGVLLLIAPSERKLRIEVGYGFEGAIPDGRAGEIIRNDIVPFFQAGKMEEGIVRGSVILLDIMSKEMGITIESSYRIPEPPRKASALRILFNLIFLFLIFGGRFFFFPLLFGFGGGYYSGGGGGFGGFSGFGGGLSGGGGASGSW